MIGIYKIENLINGKKYIGQSVDILNRWKQHLEIINKSNETALKIKKLPLYRAFLKYGIENFSFQIIEICEIEQLDEKERYWIKKYNTYIQEENSVGYNLTLGGEGTISLKEEEIQKFITLWEQGKSLSEISDECNRSYDSVKRYLSNRCESYSGGEAAKRGINTSIRKNSEIIKYYDFLGNFIAEYPSIKIAAQQLNITENVIINNLKYHSKICKNGYFVYKNENQENAIKKHMRMKNDGSIKPIVQMDLEENVLNYFISFSDAYIFLKRKYTGGINACCAGKIKTAYGFKWRYVTEKDYQKSITGEKEL